MFFYSCQEYIYVHYRKCRKLFLERVKPLILPLRNHWRVRGIKHYSPLSPADGGSSSLEEACPCHRRVKGFSLSSICLSRSYLGQSSEADTRLSEPRFQRHQDPEGRPHHQKAQS